MIIHEKLQQQSKEWFEIKKGVITGTVLKAISGTPKARQDAIYELLAERLTVGVPDEYENPMDRGNRLEPEAIASFELATGKQVKKVGFCQRDDNPFIGNSPDGLIGDREALEVKCPMGKNYVKAWITNEIPDEYYWQCIQYFVVNDNLDVLYFVLYNPDIPVYDMHTILMHRTDVEADIASALEKQRKALGEIDELLSGIVTI